MTIKMDFTIHTDMSKKGGEIYPLHRPGKECGAERSDVSLLKNYKGFTELLKKEGEHGAPEMALFASLLFEMQSTHNVPDEYTEKSKALADMAAEEKKKDVSESRDYLFFPLEVMRELYRCENEAECTFSEKVPGVYALAASGDDLGAVAIVNASEEIHFIELAICGLSGKHCSIDYYNADEYEQLSLVCNTDTKLDKTTVRIPLAPDSLHLFKIR